MAFFSKKTWKDRLVEYAGRRKITNVSTMVAQIVDVERAEGIVSEEGNALSAANMNDLEQRVADGFTSVQRTTDTLTRDLGALNDGGAIKGLEVREGDGVYITYADGADTVSKKLGDHVDPGTLISQTSVSFNQEWNQGHAYSGKTEVPCSKATITCNGFNNHNGSLTVYDSSGTVLETISIVSGTYTINKDDICRWNIGYNFPQGYASIGASFTVSLYK